MRCHGEVFYGEGIYSLPFLFGVELCPLQYPH
jgi:hypothetical protein